MNEAPKTVTRISIDHAFQLLSDNGEPDACKLLNTELRSSSGRVKLFADDAEVTARFFTIHLEITAEAGTVEVTALRPLDRSDYKWTVSGIEKLLRRDDPLPVKRWLKDEIARMRGSGRLQILVSKPKIAEDIARRMKGAAARGEVERALSVGRIRNLLTEDKFL